MQRFSSGVDAVTRPVLKIKEGVVFKSAHFLPHITRIITVALDTAPVTIDGVVWLTQAYRHIRTTLDFHELMAAFDFRCKNIVAVGIEEREVLGHLWAERMDVVLGADYDILAHGVEDNFHVHAEFDPR